MQLDEIKALVSKDLKKVDEIIHAKLASQVPLASEIASYVIDAGGKRIRPLLVLLVAQVLEYKGDAHIHLAAIIEMLHTAMLLHDDVIDHSTMRRGRNTANQKWGGAASVLVGDFLYARSFQLISDLKKSSIVDLFSDASAGIVEGEVLQLMHRHDPEILEKDYFEILRRKTGLLFSTAGISMPILMGLPDTFRELFTVYGESLGIAFQLTDDVLDYDSKTDVTGKNIGDDLAEGKPTLPLIYALKEGDEKQKKLIESALAKPEKADFKKIQKMLMDVGAIEYTKSYANTYVAKAVESLVVLPHSPARTALEALAYAAGHREA